MRTALPVQIPLIIQGKYREFFAIFDALEAERIAAEKVLSALRFLSEFPTQPNRELFLEEQGISFEVTGNSIRRTG